jgi:hypothetical protein
MHINSHSHRGRMDVCRYVRFLTSTLPKDDPCVFRIDGRSGSLQNKKTHRSATGSSLPHSTKYLTCPPHLPTDATATQHGDDSVTCSPVV